MSKSFPEKMKNFFRRTESYTYNFDGLQVETFNVTLEMLKAISNESSTGHRLRTLKEIQEYVLTKKLADNAVEAIYSRIQDLVSPQQSIEIRHETFNFYIALIKGQVEYMQIMRTILFRDILRHTVPEDIVPRFGMLKALTDDGRNVLNFEIEMGYFLMRDFFDFMTPDLSVEFLKLVITFIKFNAAYVDEAVIVGFMAYLKEVCFNSPTVEVAQECLNLMEAILCYSHLPESELDIFLYILCVTVNTEALAESSWKQMRNILGTYKGVFGISSLCNMLKEMKAKQSILRGAVYFLGMALWGVNGVSALQIPPSAVLPSFAKVLETRSFVIAREVVLALTRLVVNREDLLDGRSLFWDSIFYITEKIQNFPEFQNLSHPLDICVKELNDFLIACENKCRYEMFDSLKHLSVLLDNYSALRSDQSMIRLVSFRAESLTASKPHFILRLNNYLEKYLKTEKRTPVLLEVLRNLKEIRLMNLRVTDEDLMDQVILQNLVNSDTFTDVVVRKTVVEFLIVLADSITSSLFLDVLDIMGKIMKRMLDNLKASENEDPKDTYIDAIAAVEGLIHVFKRKLFMMPPNHCVEIFHLFVKHMQQHYLCPSYAEDAVKVRKMILEFFFEIRANKYKHVGVLKGSGSGHSVYLMCDSSPSRDEMVPSSPPPQSPSAMGPVIAHLGFDKGFQVIISCLKEEKDWRLLEMALKEIPILLQNKSLILNSNCSVGTLCSTMCQMVSGRNNIVETLRHGPLKFTRTELNGYIFPCAMTFTSYHSNLDSHIQRLLIRSLLSGLVSRSARNCIEGLTLCLLEMKNSMNKLLPDVLLQLSKISATKMVALPVLEFLSNLIRLPELYKSFVEDQYMSIFAIALPYTNPYKFNQYTVALAHHVLSMWYLKCRIPFRRDFAKFIMKGLRSNIDIPRSECKNTSNQSLDQGAKARDEKNLNLGQSSRSTQNSPREDNVTEERTDQTILELHTELMETGLDLMTRFTFGMCSNQPERSPIDEFLLEKGQKTSWVVGNKIITITTSGAGSKTFKNGLCEVCYKATHEEADKTDEIDPDPLDPDLSEDPKPQSFQLKKKRHRSAIQRRNTAYSEEISINTSKTKDDIMLHYSSSPDSSAFARRHTSYVPDTDRFSSISHGSDKQDKSHPLCSCWVTSWAEVHIRRPTGNTSWMTRMQNKLTLPSQSDVPLSILNSLVLPQLEQELEICGDSPSESDAISLLESELTEELACEGAIDITSKPKTTPPMRRTNSSPDMNTGWMSNLESKQSLLESSTELEKEEDESKLEVPSSVQPSALKQRVPDKSKSKNLKLDFAPLSHGHSSSKESAPTSVKETVRASSIGQRQLSNEAQPQPSTVPFRDRGHTISVMSPNRPTGADNSTKTSEANPRNGMSPSFVFLQLFQDSVFGITYPKPLLIPHSEANNRSLSLLDHIPPYDCHKIGVVYIGPDQAENEVAILSNVGGSSRYVAFLRGLGRMVRLRKTDPHTTYLGGLDTKRGEDGDYALIWHDDVMQVVFHEATLMKNRPSDKNRNEKKKHIANDCVMIAYNDSKADFNISTIKGQVTNACIVVRPEDFNCNVVTVSYRIPEMKESFGHTGSYLVSDESLAVFVRQMALHANLASVLISRKLQGTKYAQVSNWLERLRSIKRLRSKMEDDWNAKNADNYAFETEPSDYTDFTDYV